MLYCITPNCFSSMLNIQIYVASNNSTNQRIKRLILKKSRKFSEYDNVNGHFSDLPFPNQTWVEHAPFDFR